MELKEEFYYAWDEDLEYNNDNFADYLSQDEYETKLASEIPFPSDYLLAKFSKLAYSNHKFLLPKDWKLLTTAHNNKWTNNYFGVAFWNPKLCHIVIAHRGTDIKNLGALITDLKLACKKEKAKQAESAATFVHTIRKAITDRKFEKGPPFQLSITGHSLGAWLAQITTFTVKYLKKDDKKLVEDDQYQNNIHPHTVVFESPGCREALTKLAKGLNPYLYLHRKCGNYNVLDMTVYLSKLNPINVINHHVGTVYMVASNTHYMNDILKLFDETTHHIEKETVLHFKSGKRSATKRIFELIFPLDLDKSLIKRAHNNDECSLNVFTEEELDFVKDWVFYRDHPLQCLEEFKDTHSLPCFNINYDYNIIKSSHLNRAIACIKHLRPSKALMVELLRKDIPNLHKLFKEMLALETQHLQETLLEFRYYYFKDKYGLHEFLKTENFMLHIRIENNDNKYDLDSSIVNHIIKLNKNIQQYYIIKWKKLKGLIKFFPEGIRDSELPMIVIDFSEADDDDFQEISDFLKNKTKIVIISSDKHSWKQEGVNIKEVTGYGSNVKFQDLTEDSQCQFINQKHFKINENEISLKDITNIGLPLNEEIYEKLNQVISIEILMEFLFTPITEHIALDVPYLNSLKALILSDLYHEVDLDQILTKANQNILFLIEGDQKHFNALKNDNSNVIIKKEIDFEKECLRNLNENKKTIYFFVIQNEKLFLNNIFNSNFYIPRHITHKNIVNPQIFKSLNKSVDRFICYGNEKKFELNKEGKPFFQFKSTEYNEHNGHILYIEPNTHILNIDENTVTWKHSRGNIESLRKYIEPQRNGGVKEHEIIKDRIVILSGKPGSGKTSAIARLYLQYQKTHWVFAIPLKYACFNEISSNINVDKAAKFIVYSTSISNKDCIQHLLSYCLKHQTNLPIYLMFDAFDEIPNNNHRRNFIDLINFLKRSTTANILITTQNFRCKQLENELCVFASSFTKFDQNKEVIDFCTNFWCARLRLFEENIDEMHLKKCAIGMLESAEEILGDDIYKIMGLPLHMKMLAEVMLPTISTTSITFIDMLGLYQKYIQLHYDNYFNKKELNDPVIAKWLTEALYTKLLKLAMAKLQQNTIEIEYDDLEELNKIGLVQSEPGNILNYDFQHDSVRDYFIAYLLKNWLESRLDFDYMDCDIKNFIITEILIKQEFKEIRLFLNLMLKDSTLSQFRLQACCNHIKQLVNQNQTDLLYNNQKESGYHVCIKEGLVFLLKRLLQNTVDNEIKINLLSKPNINKETPLYLALTSPETEDQKEIIEIFRNEFENWPISTTKIILLSTLFTYLITDQHIDKLTAYFQNCSNISSELQQIIRNRKYINDYLNACKFDDINKLKTVLENFRNDKITKRYLLLATNERMESGLHLTSNKEIADMLLKHGCDKDLEDNHGMTALNRAIKENRTDIAEKLIQKNTANTTDLIGNSPLMHAVKYNQFSIVKLLLDPKRAGTKCNINQPNSFQVTPLMLSIKNANKNTENIVRYLLEKGADVNARDCNGMSPIFHAVKAKNISLMRLLKQHGADINVQDVNGTTPLLYSITKNHWSTVQCLLDNGADVNLGNMWGTFPLQKLIKMKQDKHIKRILRDEKTETGTIIRAAAKTHFLNEYEMNYIKNISAANEAK